MKNILVLLAVLSFLPQSHAGIKKCVDLVKLVHDIDNKSRSPHSNLDLLSFFGLADEDLGFSNIAKTSVADILYKVRETQPDKFEKAKKELIDIYADFAKQSGVTPSLKEMSLALQQRGFNINVERLIGENLFFDNEHMLYEIAGEKHPAVKKAINSRLSSPQKRAAIQKAIEKSNTVIVTSAVDGAKVNETAIHALLNIAEKRNGIVIVRIVNLETYALDPILEQLEKTNPRFFVSIDDIQLSRHWNLNTIKIMGKQLNPTMGLDRLWDRGVKQVVASPKLEMKAIPTKDNSLVPHQIFTTGAITEAQYAGNKYISGRTDEIAKDDHVIGALILEKTQFEGKNFGLEVTGDYHPRHLEFLPETKGFVDMGTLYTADGSISKTSTKALVLGDLHVGSTYQILLETLTPLIKRLKPETIVLHDAWDGIPVNHHASKKAVEQAMKAESGGLDIVKGLSEMANYINALLDIAPSIEIVIDRSNHPDWLAKWVDNTDNSLTTPYNDKVKTELKMAMLRGEDPFLYALKNGVNGSIPVNPNKFKRVIFPQNSFKVGPDHRQVELAEHGDKGANGAKASIQAFARGTDRAIYGHTHKNERKNGIVNIGTFTPMLMPYNKGGFSNWSNSLAVVDEHGGIQVLTFNNGEWHTDYKYKPRADFYFPGYPEVKPSFHAPTTGAGQVDQYSR